MPGKRGEGVYSIKELSPSARNRVLDKWRYEIWDDTDSDNLSADFKETLSERGFSNPDVCWGLSYSQGDGVAFWGTLHAVDLFKWIFSGDKRAKPFVKQAKSFVLLQDVVSIRVTHSGNYCHSNSMDVEVEVTGEEMDLVPEKYRNEVRKFYNEKLYAFEDWQRDKRQIEHQRNAPIYAWNERINARSRQMKRGPKEWRPPIGPRPAPFDIPIPPEPDLDIPVRIQRMMDQAVRTFSEIDPLVNGFQEFVSEWVKDTSRELEKRGYDEMEYRQSDENIIEFLEANEFEFDEDGEKI
jgi:hypothetical protein